ncbi:hypothetical protein HAX54_048208 [Datura stramonium]|uniref:Uncharacterized protein n=1 Tax=Datura stramonium TaxID=4076 RepID=A0ABS8STZ9_DATST|nr:hypothetical protein [Datura stramonium]
MGFFSPGNSENRYVGMWYKNISVRTVVWVANREAPLTGGSGILKVRSQDSRSFLNEAGDKNNGNFLWQSFDHPTDTLLAGMKLGRNFVTGREVYLSSWKSEEDPAPGDSTYHCDTSGYPQNILKKGSDVVYRLDRMVALQWDTKLKRSCKSQYSPVCGCLDKFVPNNSDAWKKTDWSGGCVRELELKGPNGGQDIYIRMAASESDNLEQSDGKKGKYCSGPTIIGWFDSVFLSLLIYHRRRKKALELKNKGRSGCCGKYKMNYNSGNCAEEFEVPLFDLSTIAKATNNFSIDRQIGEGGFGTVYKGTLEGQEIAVKRLSRTSTQGENEFKNEVVYIAKLQHRNLISANVVGVNNLAIYRHGNSIKKVDQQNGLMEYLEDRPSMSSAVMMLNNEGVLPQAKRPGFYIEKDAPDGELSSSHTETPITILVAR